MSDRYRLHNGPLLRRLLDSHKDGEPATVRELAARTGLSRSKVQALVDEDRPTVTGAEALSLAGVYKLAPRALVHPASMSMDMDNDPVTRRDSTDGNPHPGAALAPSPHRGPDELGEHTRPDEPHGEGPSRGRWPV